jgi:hypothetical protein
MPLSAIGHPRSDSPTSLLSLLFIYTNNIYKYRIGITSGGRRAGLTSGGKCGIIGFAGKGLSINDLRGTAHCDTFRHVPTLYDTFRHVPTRMSSFGDSLN